VGEEWERFIRSAEPPGGLLGATRQGRDKSNRSPTGSRPIAPPCVMLPKMTTPGLILAQIAARFARFDVVKNRGGRTLHDRQSEATVARLRPLSDEDAFELYYWFLVRERWS
jgi:hypothetical protein